MDEGIKSCGFKIQHIKEDNFNTKTSWLGFCTEAVIAFHSVSFFLLPHEGDQGVFKVAHILQQEESANVKKRVNVDQISFRVYILMWFSFKGESL